jgi:6-phosphogluconolactonase (cycloisomerase 2 family)
MLSRRFGSAFAIASFLALQSLLGCSGFFTDRATTTTTPNGSTSFAFVSNFNNAATGSISIYNRDTGTGALTANGSIATGDSSDGRSFGPAALATANSGSFLYSANDGGGISAFAVNSSNGALTTVSGSPFLTGLLVPTAIAVDPTSKFVYAADSGAAGIGGYAINASTGALSTISGSPFLTLGLRALSVTVHPNGRFVYTALGAFGTGIFAIDTNSGALSNFSVEPPFAGGQPQEVALNPAGTLAYVANGVSGVEAYSVNSSSGALTRIGNAAFATGNNPIALTVDSGGKFVYVVNRDDNNAANDFITALAIQSDGSLAAINNGVLAVSSPSAVAIEPGNKFVYVTDFNSSAVSIFSVNATTGQLTAAGSVAAGTNPSSIAFR